MNKALLVGINDYHSQTALAGCVNDVTDLAAALVAHSAVASADVVTLLDSAATKSAILSALSALIEALKPGDRGYFHFSGHGVRMPSSDPDEPDGLDEVLCSYEFDWTPETAISDNELLLALRSLQLGAHLIFTIDSCHSGDFSRELLRPNSCPRTLAPPPGVGWRRGAATRRLRALGRAPNVTFVSAVLPWQVAADTTFDGRPNGAFTYHFLREAARTDGAVSEVVLAIEPALRRFEMTPIVERADAIYFGSPAPRASSNAVQLSRGRARLAARPSAARAATVVFEQSWETILLGHEVGISAQVAAASGELSVSASVALMGRAHVSPRIRVTGSATHAVALGVLGLSLELSISEWSNAGDAFDFLLGLALTSSIPFVPRAQVARVPVHVQVGDLTCGLAPMAVASPSDLMALLTLEHLSTAARGDTSPPRGRAAARAYRDPRIQVLASGIAKWGPNWREDRVIRPFADRPRPDGITRHSVDLGPQRGAGAVSFEGWLSDQETDFDFVIHIGNHFFGGWGEIEWRVQGVYADVQPFPRDVGARRSEEHPRVGAPDAAIGAAQLRPGR